MQKTNKSSQTTDIRKALVVPLSTLSIVHFFSVSKVVYKFTALLFNKKSLFHRRKSKMTKVA